MPTIVTSTVLDAPAEEVWALLRDFAAIGWSRLHAEAVAGAQQHRGPDRGLSGDPGEERGPR